MLWTPLDVLFVIDIFGVLHCLPILRYTVPNAMNELQRGGSLVSLGSDINKVRQMPYPLSMTEEVRKWLKSQGFNNHCFISYPRARHGKGSTEFAERVRESILEELEQFGVTEPIIYIDKKLRLGLNGRKT